MLDGIRASLAFNQSRLDPSTTRVASIGYSGGALATGWTSALQPTYAPELKLIAASFGGTYARLRCSGADAGRPSNLSAVLNYLDGVRADAHSSR